MVNKKIVGPSSENTRNFKAKMIIFPFLKILNTFSSSSSLSCFKIFYILSPVKNINSFVVF